MKRLLRVHLPPCRHPGQLLRRAVRERWHPGLDHRQRGQTAMAGEYSRELSTKVFAGQCRLIELGYRQVARLAMACAAILVDQT